MSDLPPPLRAPAQERPFHVLLVEPEIPPNTGNIARLCGATCCPLHLVGKLGFRIDEHAVRRAGLDYWHLVEVLQHADFPTAQDYIRALPTRHPPGNASEPTQLGERSQAGEANTPRFWFFSSHSRRSYLDVAFRAGDALVFGKESVGLPTDLLKAHPESVVAIPTLGAVRSLNLSNAVSITLFEALRQIGALVTRND